MIVIDFINDLLPVLSNIIELFSLSTMLDNLNNFFNMILQGIEVICTLIDDYIQFTSSFKKIFKFFNEICLCVTLAMTIISITIIIAKCLINRYISYVRKTDNISKTNNIIHDTKLIEQFERERIGYLCCICTENARNVLFMPCKHLCICNDCYNLAMQVNSMKNCPICRASIINYIRVYC
jgi:hypothetical protein